MRVAVRHSSPSRAEPDLLAEAPRRRWPSLTTVGGLLGLVVLRLLLGGQRLRTTYWIDEGLTVGIASHPLTSIPGVLVKDGSPPLYYLLLGVWIRLFGTGEVATHSLSLLLALAVPVVAFWAAGRLFDRRAAWFTAVFAALSPFVTYFSGETRMYVLVVLESLLFCVAFSAAFVEHRRRGPVWFAVSLAALVYTHYWAFYAAAGAVTAVIVLILLAGGADRRRLVRDAAVGFGGAAVLFLPWLPTFLHQLGSTGAPWAHTPTLRGVLGELAALVRDERVLVALGVAVAVGLAPAAQRLWRSRRQGPSDDAVRLASIILIGAAPVVIGWTLAHLEPSWATRYLAVAVGPLILIVGVGLSRARGLGVGALVIAALLILQPVTRISPGIGVGKTSKSNAKEMAATLKPDLPAGTLVLVTQSEAVPLIAHYFGEGLRYADPRGLVADPHVMDWRDAEEQLDAARIPGALAPAIDALQPGDRVLLVTSTPPERDTDTSWLEQFRVLDRQWQRFLSRETCLQPYRRVAAPTTPTDTPFRATAYECR
jgi:hypothetical protein